MYIVEQQSPKINGEESRSVGGSHKVALERLMQDGRGWISRSSSHDHDYRYSYYVQTGDENFNIVNGTKIENPTRFIEIGYVYIPFESSVAQAFIRDSDGSFQMLDNGSEEKMRLAVEQFAQKQNMWLQQT